MDRPPERMALYGEKRGFARPSVAGQLYSTQACSLRPAV